MSVNGVRRNRDAFAFSDWRQRLGVEREYKWSLDEPGPALLRDGESPGDTLARMPLPAGFTAKRAYTHTQMLVYLDCQWMLTSNESSLTFVVNEGPTGELSWIKSKQTISWHGMRRDALEVAEKIDPAQVSAAVSDRPALPVHHLTRAYRGPVALTPFATSVQTRWKMGVMSERHNPMTVSWDDCTLREIDSDGGLHFHCVEAETNMMDEDACDDLGALADAVTAFLGVQPTRLSKSRRAAQLCGWTPATAVAA